MEAAVLMPVKRFSAAKGRLSGLLDGAQRVAHLPATLVTGRYDMCTPPNNAYALAQCLPLATLTIVPGAGHYPTEHALARACISAGRDLHRRITAETR